MRHLCSKTAISVRNPQTAPVAVKRWTLQARAFFMNNGSLSNTFHLKESINCHYYKGKDVPFPPPFITENDESILRKQKAAAMQEHKQFPQSAFRYVDGSRRSFWERLQDMWFAPKRFESTALYERLGVLLIKKYAPTGGDFFIRRYGIRIVDVRGTLDSLIHFERYTRRLEAIHEIAFLGFSGWSLWRAAVHQTTLLDFGFAIVVYILLILSPAMLQRYNRLRLYPVIRRLAASQVHFKNEDER